MDVKTQKMKKTQKNKNSNFKILTDLNNRVTNFTIA